MTETLAKIRCKSCLQLNRVSLDKLGKKPLCGSCKTTLDIPAQPEWARADSFDRTVSYWAETLLVVFTAPLCVYCKIFEPVLHDLARKRMGKLKVLKVDTEVDTLLAQRFKIEKTPTFIVYRSGVELIRVDGPPKDKSDLVMWIDNLINSTNV
jgi:thiol-disulfide isomerase/thioredoxin